MRDHLKNLGPSNRASNPKSTRVSAVKIKPGPTATSTTHPRSDSTNAIPEDPHSRVDEHTSLLRSQLTAKDGIQALHQSHYGSPSSLKGDLFKSILAAGDGNHLADEETSIPPGKRATFGEGDTSPTDSAEADPSGRKRGYVRSGSITENIVEAGGIRKVVLEANSSSDSEEAEDRDQSHTTSGTSEGDKTSTGNRKKKNRRKTRK
jgi:metal transporter CNNM